jgi:hypothetical protein
MFSGSFSLIALSNHTTFSQTETDATVPLSTDTILNAEDINKELGASSAAQQS